MADMTRGRIAPTLIRFSIPLILSGLLQQLYGWVDALILGNFAGEEPLAAVGATGTVSGLYLALLSGFAVGVSILVAQGWGAGNRGVAGQSLGCFSAVAGAASLVLCILGILTARPLLALLRTPGEIVEQAAGYLVIVLCGIPFLAVYNIYNAVLHGMGDSRTPLYSIGVSAGINILLDLLFVAGWGWGVRGAALATAISQAAMTLFLVAYTPLRHRDARFRPGRGMIRRDLLRRGLSLGIPTTIQGGARSVGGLLLQNVMNLFGTQVVAAITTAYRIDSVMLLPINNLGSGLTTFTAQNRGAGEKERIRKGLRAGWILMVLAATVITAVVVPSATGIMGWFGVSEQVVELGREFIWFCAAFYPMYGLLCALSSYLQGMGDVRFAMGTGIAALGLRILLSYLLMGLLGHRVIAVAEMISWVAHTAACLLRCRYLHRVKSAV